jgi:hypothetical protein
MEQIFTYLLARLVERSTWVGLISLLASFGVIIKPEQATTIATIAASMAGVIMLVTKDNRPTTGEQAKAE